MAMKLRTSRAVNLQSSPSPEPAPGFEPGAERNPGRIQRAADAAWRAVQQQSWERSNRERLRGLIARGDHLLSELEDQIEADRPSCPAGLLGQIRSWARASQLGPGDQARDGWAAETPTELLDRLFEIQGELLQRRAETADPAMVAFDQQVDRRWRAPARVRTSIGLGRLAAAGGLRAALG